jgi:hypothetical protein
MSIGALLHQQVPEMNLQCTSSLKVRKESGIQDEETNFSKKFFL